MKAAKIELSENTFEAVSREWVAKYSSDWQESHSSKILRRLEKDAFPWIGLRPIAKLNTPELLKILRRVEARGVLETAHRILQY